MYIAIFSVKHNFDIVGMVQVTVFLLSLRMTYLMVL